MTFILRQPINGQLSTIYPHCFRHTLCSRSYHSLSVYPDQICGHSLNTCSICFLSTLSLNRFFLLQVLRAASPALLRVIALGAFFIYCTVSAFCHDVPNAIIIICSYIYFVLTINRNCGFSLFYSIIRFGLAFNSIESVPTLFPA